jgi:Ca2+-binding RTX toxin-like protein
VNGNDGNDLISGGGGDDTLNAADGVPGNDAVYGGPGTDTCTADVNDLQVGCETVVVVPTATRASR